MKVKIKMLKFFLALIFGYLSLASQNQGNNWHFGNQSGLNFNSGSPVISNSAFVGSYSAPGSTNEGVASISNTSGQTLFYTDGQTIYNANHLPMSNGTGLLGNSSSTQSGIILPKPGSTTQYYVFTADALSAGNTIKYSIVDISLNAGLGDVIIGKKNLNMPFAITPPSTFAEKLTAVPKSGGLGFWLIAHRSNETGSTGTFIVWDVNCSLTNDGLSELLIAGARQSIGSASTTVYANELGYLKVSSDLTKIAYANSGAHFAEVFNFDNSTGVISNPRKVTETTLGAGFLPYGVEFSPNGNYLYVGDLYHGPIIVRYDLSQANLDIPGSCQVFGSSYTTNGSSLVSSGSQNGGWPAYYTLGSLQTAPDGKIYGALPGRDHVLTISNPNDPFPTILENGLVLAPGGYNTLGLPNFFSSISSNNWIFLDDNNACSNIISSTSASNIPNATYNWNFGNGSTSNLQNPQYSYISAGTYTVSLTITDANGCQSIEELEVLIDVPSLTVTVNSPTICTGQTIVLQANSTAVNYNWSTMETTSSISVSPLTTTSYTVIGSDINGCTGSAVSTVTVNSLPVITVNSPTICVGQSANLTANGSSDYSWNTGSINNPLLVSPLVTTIYTVTETSSGCSATQIATVTVNQSPMVTVNSPTICVGEITTLTANSNVADYSWSTTETTSSISVSPSATTSYTVVSSGANGCDGYAVSTVTVNQLPIVTVNSPTICAGQTTLLSANGALGYSWNTGAITNSISISPLSSISYTVTGTDANSCQNTGIASVTVLPLPSASLIADTTVCNDSPLQINIVAGGNSVLWNTGSSSEGITVTQAGEYWVMLSNGTCSSTDTVSIQFFTAPDLGPDLIRCAGNTVVLSSNTTTGSYLWSNGSTSSSITINNTNSYWVDVSSGTCIIRDSIEVKFVTAPVVDLGNDTSFCNADFTAAIILDAGATTAAVYTWSTGESSQSISVSEPGSFWVEVNNGCSTKDTVTMSLYNGIELGSNKILCGQEEIKLIPSLGRNTEATYLWSTGEMVPSITIEGPGTYWVEVSQGSCLFTDSVEVLGSISEGALFVPNTFTPGTDYLNDVFYAEGESIITFNMKIFNRWGTLIFESNKQSDGWDGTYKGRMVQCDTYVWVIDYATDCNDMTAIRKTGVVNVVR